MANAEVFLWHGFSRHEVLHLWKHGAKDFARYYSQFRRQDHSLLTLDGLDPLQAADDSKKTRMRMTTQGVMETVVPRLRQAFPTAEGCQGSGVLRQIPEELLAISLGPSRGYAVPAAEAVNGGNVGLALWLAGTKVMGLEGVVTDYGGWQYQWSPLPSAVPILATPGADFSNLDPSDLTEERWLSGLQKELPGWEPHAQELFAAFQWLQECPADASGHEDITHRMSLNEFIAALICSSQGTAAQKAAALFDAFSQDISGPVDLLFHRKPISSLARFVCEDHSPDGNEDEEQVAARGGPASACLLPPANLSSACLHIKVWFGGFSEELVGQVFVRSLHPFAINFGIEPDFNGFPGLRFSVWATREKGIWTCVGELGLLLFWQPRTAETPNVGKLSVCVKGLHLFDNPLLLHMKQSGRPRIEVLTYDEECQPRHIVLADNTTVGLKDGLTALWAPKAGADSIICFSAEDAFLQEDLQTWLWAGAACQTSRSDLLLVADKVVPPARLTHKVIDTNRVRMVADVILRRAGHHLASRQAVQLADICFQRCGNSTALLDALLIDQEELGDLSTADDIRKGLQGAGATCADISSYLTLELEKQMSQGFGSLNLWSSNLFVAKPSLASMQIGDPFPGKRKLLYLRFARAGDGEKFIITRSVDENGDFLQTEEVCFDPAFPSVRNGMLTKEEFVSCLLDSSVLSEPLRRLAAPVYCRGTSAIEEEQTFTLDVTVAVKAGVPTEVAESVAATQELPVLFGNEAQGGAFSSYTAPDSSVYHHGSGHGVEVNLNDTIGDLLLKVSEACERLAKQLMRTGSHQGVDLARLYRFVEIDPDDAVLVFCPPRPAFEATPADQDQLENFIGAHALTDNWRPLNKDFTFRDYTSRYGFGRPENRIPPCLRIVKASEQLRQENAQYRRFLAEQGYFNEISRYYALRSGWALYHHRDDKDSREWRPCLLWGPVETAMRHDAGLVTWAHHTPPPNEQPPVDFTSGTIILDSDIMA
eukprot:TRINITY_DN13607_c0_g1_i1.p1 TRINITY_DN13607_c0_g1~~TRINITY_DN13607_c0_g1_i1.p1  ORF type:complete len:1017 (-),score=182.43 TRINITY_DN13607_c0_g1_i1:251-3232(-)